MILEYRLKGLGWKIRRCATTSPILRIQVVSAHARSIRHILGEMGGLMLVRPVLTFL